MSAKILKWNIELLCMLKLVPSEMHRLILYLFTALH